MKFMERVFLIQGLVKSLGHGNGKAVMLFEVQKEQTKHVRVCVKEREERERLGLLHVSTTGSSRRWYKKLEVTFVLNWNNYFLPTEGLNCPFLPGQEYPLYLFSLKIYFYFIFFIGKRYIERSRDRKDLSSTDSLT